MGPSRNPEYPMSKAIAIATKCHTTLQRATLSVAQESAIDALASGKKDAEAATLVGVNRVTVTRWRLYSPHFQAALNERRQAIWVASLDRLRSLVPLALEAVADELANPASPNRLQAAFGLLKLVPLVPLVPLGVVASGPTDPDEIVRRIVDHQRRTNREPLDSLIDRSKGLPALDDHVGQVWAELTAKAGESPA